MRPTEQKSENGIVFQHSWMHRQTVSSRALKFNCVSGDRRFPTWGAAPDEGSSDKLWRLWAGWPLSSVVTAGWTSRGAPGLKRSVGPLWPSWQMWLSLFLQKPKKKTASFFQLDASESVSWHKINLEEFSYRIKKQIVTFRCWFFLLKGFPK